MMKFNIIKNELHNIMNTQLKRVGNHLTVERKYNSKNRQNAQHHTTHQKFNLYLKQTRHTLFALCAFVCV